MEYGSLPVYDQFAYLHLRPVEIYRVDAAVPPVQSYPASNPVVVSGDVSSIVPLSATGVLRDRTAVLAGDKGSSGVAQAPDATWAMTDGNQREVTTFGGIRNDESYVLAANQELPNHVSGVPDSFEVVNGAQHQTVEAPIGAQSVAASSFGPLPLYEQPAVGPAAAFDNDPRTAWSAAVTNDSVGQWISISFAKPIHMSSIKLTPISGSLQQPTITRVKLTTDKGSVVRDLPPGRKTYELSLAAGDSKNLKITLLGVTPASLEAGGGIVVSAGIQDVAIPGVSFAPRLLLPNDEAAAFSKATAHGAVVSFSRTLNNSNLSLGLTSTDDPDMAREFTLPKTESVTATASALPKPNSELEQMIHYFSPVPNGSLKVTASSTLGGLPKFSAQNLVEADTPEPWIANLGDKHPSIDVSWPGKRAVSEVELTTTSGASAPTEVAITPLGGQTVDRSLSGKQSVLKFPTTVTDSLKISFLSASAHLSVTPANGVGVPLPVGLHAVSVPGLLTVADPGPNVSNVVFLPCGKGPQVTLDGKDYGTSAYGTVGNLINLQPMLLSLCTPPSGLVLQRGVHNFKTSDSSSQFLLSSFVMQPAHSSAVPPTRQRPVTVVQWASESRTVHVGAGPATYIVMAQNFNPGWVAHFNNEKLQAVRIDGWEQGFLVPAGGLGTSR